MIVYHGSVDIVTNPDVKHSYRNLDFGCGFYVTTVKEQAERWATRKTLFKKGTNGTVSVYNMIDIPEELALKEFDDNLEDWIDFVCECRSGSEKYLEYDLISGKVADDKVYRVVDLYRRGIWDKQRAISEMKAYETYDQVAFISQRAIDSILSFADSYEVSTDD